MQVADEKTVLDDFASAKFRYAGITSTFFKRVGRFLVNTDGPDGKLADFEVKFTLGTPVVEAIGAEAKSRFTGRIPKVTVDVK